MNRNILTAEPKELEKIIISSHLNYLRDGLLNIQNVCIGLFKPNYSKVWELVIEAEPFEEDGHRGHLINSLTIGDLFGLSTSSSSTLGGRYIPFPLDRTLTQMMEEPLEFDYWYKSVITS